MQDLDQKIRDLFIPLIEGINKILEKKAEKNEKKPLTGSEDLPDNEMYTGVKDFIKQKKENPLSGKEI